MTEGINVSDIGFYRCWRYHRTEKPRLCETRAAVEALGPDWADTPFPPVVVPAPAVTSTVPKDPAFTTVVYHADQALRDQVRIPVSPVAGDLAMAQPDKDRTARAADLYANNVEAVLADLKYADAARLTELVELEQAHPKIPGGRKQVLRAVAERIAKIAPAAAAP